MKVPARLPCAWGATPDELEARYPCDGWLGDPDAALARAVDVDAAAVTTFRWVCQLRVAPYSYDWIDNWGRRSPQQLTPGLEHLAIGQPSMRIFELVDFEPGHQVTLWAKDPRAVAAFGAIAVSYVVRPAAGGRSRLVVKLLVRYPRRAPWAWMRALLPWGDLFMMRKQLLTLKALAERHA